ncbi:MAG: sigma-70 family RNA polymerase sigma factor [Verrucomicrobia bacterium]|nr:sigma-70 family RNA polymerase sigma factor [Verrucomicrobiota bacterium]
MISLPDDEASQQALFKRWLDLHSGLIYKVARTFAPDEVDRDDLAQEILLQLWRSLPRFQGLAKESTWIYRVALNTALAWHRGEKKRRSTQTSLPAIEELPEPDDRAARERSDQVTRLYTAVRKLPKVDAALVLLYLDDLSYREMADVLGISETNVGVKLNRARKTLASLMKEVPHE